MRYYSDDFMKRLYAPGERMTFSNGATVIVAEQAARFALDLVDLDRETKMYRRVNSDPGMETAVINEAKYRERLLGRPNNYGNRLP